MSADPGELAVALLLSHRLGEEGPQTEASEALAVLSEDELAQGLPDDRTKLAFWIDIYNAAVLRQPPDATASRGGRLRLFRRPSITVAGRHLSLDAIEHGILRHSSWKLGLGYLRNPRPAGFERRHRVAHIDPRIHFALNCGARSCPPIAAYTAQAVDAQLEQATRGYLAAETVRDGDTLRVPATMLWFIGDFGGPPGMRRFLAEHGVDGSGRVRFLRYDWSPAPDHWSEDA